MRVRLVAAALALGHVVSATATASRGHGHGIATSGGGGAAGKVSANTVNVEEVTPQPPSFAFILQDDTGFNDIGYQQTNRSVPIHTPRLDSLAAEGIKLTEYYVQPICTPTRAALMTGRYPFRTGMQHFTTLSAGSAAHLPLEHATIAEVFKSRGYDTHAIGKWYVLHTEAALRRTVVAFPN